MSLLGTESDKRSKLNLHLFPLLLIGWSIITTNPLARSFVRPSVCPYLSLSLVSRRWARINIPGLIRRSLDSLIRGIRKKQRHRRRRRCPDGNRPRTQRKGISRQTEKCRFNRFENIFFLSLSSSFCPLPFSSPPHPLLPFLFSRCGIFLQHTYISIKYWLHLRL